MRRVSKCALVITLSASATVAVSAEVKTRDRTQLHLEGMLGRVAGIFGGKPVKKAINPETGGLSAEQFAAVLALYPMLKSANERLQKEGAKLRGTPLATTTTFEAVKSKEQLQQQKQTGGGLGGMLARRMMKKEEKPRATVFTLNHETLEITTTVVDGELAIPAGFRQK